MKTLRSFLAVVLALLALFTTSAFAQTNAVGTTNQTVLADVAATAKQAVSTNINQVMIEILSGVKNASGEAYRFTKGELGQGYDFLKKEAPQVLEEFLKWQVAKGVIYILLGFTVCIVLYIVSIGIDKYAKSTYVDDLMLSLKWFVRLVGIAVLLIVLTNQGLTITKIVIAPRVYIIQYVMDVASGKDVSQYR